MNIKLQGTTNEKDILPVSRLVYCPGAWVRVDEKKTKTEKA